MSTVPLASRVDRETTSTQCTVSPYTNSCKALHVRANSKVAQKEQSGMFRQEKVDLSSNFVGGAGFQAMIQSFVENDTLHTLIASSNGITNEAAVFFCRAVGNHPSLTSVDFSGNPISLPAALALIQLMHNNQRILEIRLENTNIDEPVLRRIRRILNLRNKHAAHALETTTNIDVQRLTPFQRVKAEHEQRHAERRNAVQKDAHAVETGCGESVRAWVASQKLLPPLRGDGGWCIVNVYISTTPADFVSELRLIHRKLIPELNAKYCSRRVWLHPISMYVDVPSQKYSSFDRFACLNDHCQAVSKSMPLFIHLFGDKIGLLQHTPSSNPQCEKSAKAARRTIVTSTSRPIQEVDYQNACASGGCNIAAFRHSVLKMKVPSALIGLMTDDPHLAFPDPNFALVKAAVADSRGALHSMAFFDIEVAKKKWEKHMEFRKRVNQQHAAPLLMTSYEAEFCEVDAQGNVLLKNLDRFYDSLLRRVDAVLESLFPLAEKVQPSPLSVVHNAFCGGIADALAGRKHLLGKLDLYTVTPPSRNMALICGGTGSGNTTTLGSFVHRSIKRGTYKVAYHFCHHPQLRCEPSDPRTVFMSLIQQLLPDETLPLYIKCELDVQKVKQHFIDTVASAVGASADKIVVIAIDGIEDIDPFVLPCASLRTSDTGTDAWNPTVPSTTLTLAPHKPTAPRSPDEYDWIPVCLSRNLRMVITTGANSQAQKTLSQRGHDSCDPLFTGELGDNDIETIITEGAKKIGLTISDEEVNIVRSKTDSRVPGYLRFVLDALQRREESPTYLSRLVMLQQLPQTLAECCESTIRAMESEFGIGIAKTFLCLLVLSRWGLLELELRILLSAQFALKWQTEAPELINYESLQQLLRRLRPVLLLPIQCTTDDGQSIPLGGLDCICYISSRAFKEAVHAKYLADEPATVRRAHQQLAHFYKKVTHTENHPLQARAVKELPYHLICAEMWDTLENSVVCLDYISLAYKHELGYPAVRELIRAYNTLDAKRTSSSSNVDALLLKLKEFVYFVKGHNINLVQYPHMVRQIAITTSPDSLIYRDAKEFFKTQGKQLHFSVMNKTKGKLHRDAVTACQFAPSGLRFATCSDDRGIRICNLFGETLISINQSVSKVKLLTYSPTSRYLSCVCEDRSLLVFDATSGALVSKSQAHNSVIRSLCMSARGRFVLTGSDDRDMKVWESETGALVATASHAPYSHHTSAYSGVNALAAHPMEEGTFYSMCERKVVGWKLNDARDGCVQSLLVSGHHSSPLGSFHLIEEGSYIVTCSRDLPPPQGSQKDYVRTEDNLKVWSIHSGRLVATLSMGTNTQPFGPIFSTVSPNERLVASALLDGSMQLHELNCRMYASDCGEPVTVTPLFHFSAFAGNPVPKILVIRFAFDSSIVCAGGNQRHIKIWRTQPEDTNQAESPVAEFLMDQTMTCIDWTSNPAADGGEVIIGDSVGKLHVLRLTQQ